MIDEKKPVSEEELPAGQMEEGDFDDRSGNRIPGVRPGQPAEENGRPVCQDEGETDEGRGEDPCGDENDPNEDPQVLAVPDSDGADPDSGSEEDPRKRISELREELKQLEERITAKEEAYRRLERECAEFRELYPGVPLEGLSDKVWEDVQRGIPVAAAFALAERRRILLEEKAQKSNQQNKKCAPETICGKEELFFSPAEVRAMSPKQVRENYEKIMLSMQKWN